MRRNRFIFYGAWILSLVGISFFGGVVSYGIFCALTVLCAVMYLYLLCVMLTFKIYQQLDTKSVVCRTPVGYYFTLQNETFFAFARISVAFYEFGVDYGDLNKDEEYELTGNTGSRISTCIVCKYRGEYEIGVKKVIVTDFLKLFSITYKNPEPFKVSVLPAIVFPDGSPVDENSSLVNHSANNSPDTKDVLVRPYIKGDAMRSINWKATAGSGKLMTSNMISEDRSTVHILLDTRRRGASSEEYLPHEDELLTRLITMVLYYINQSISTDVYYYSQGPMHLKLKSMREFEEFYACISGVRFDKDADFDSMRLNIMRSGVVDEANLLILTDADADQAMKREETIYD